MSLRVQLTELEREMAAIRLEDCLQREMNYGLGLNAAAHVVSEVVEPILSARASSDYSDTLNEGQ
jgi:hypothetical protein